MKKRILSTALVVVMALTLLPISALAAGRNYGNIPIYVGYSDVDYMAEEILKEIATDGKSATEQISAVYDWMLESYGSYTWLLDGAPIFTENEIMTQVDRYFYGQTNKALEKGEILIRPEYDDEMVYDSQYGKYVVSYDSNQYISAFAKEIMFNGIGSSEHYSALLAVLLGHLGFDCRVIAGNFIDNSGVSSEHKWNYVLVDGQYYWLDVQKDAAAYTGSAEAGYKYFMVKDTVVWSKTHSWDDDFSTWLDANAGNIAEEYGYSAAVVSGEPWSRCADWAQDQMKQAYRMDLIPERLQNRDLTAAISRAEFAAVTVAMYEKLSGKTVPAYKGQSPFTDTEDADVLKAYSLGVVKGIGGDLYAPNGTLTREQAMTMLGRVYELVNDGAVGDGSGLPHDAVQKFDDDNTISGYARDYIYFFVATGVVNGVGNNLLDPLSQMNRQSAIKMTVEAAK